MVGTLPVGTILTIAAAGSEGSPDSVITREDGMFKRGASGDGRGGSISGFVTLNEEDCEKIYRMMV